MNETIAQYLAFLWEQFQYDWSWMSNPWVLYTVIPVFLYLIFFFVKWVVLLAPITIPIMTWGWCLRSVPLPHKKRKENSANWENN